MNPVHVRLAGLAVAPMMVMGLASPAAAAEVNPGYATSNGAVFSQMATAGAATGGKVSCYRPEVPYFTVNPYNFYTGMSACDGAAGRPAANTGEATGAAAPYATQAGSNPGYPAAGPMLVKDHSESDIRSDPAHPGHLIGSSKWVVSAEGYNHMLGFYESWDNGQTWPVQGHVPGYEGWTDNTDPVGAFDSEGNYYELLLPYQFFYDPDGTHDFTTNPQLQPNPTLESAVISIAIHPYAAQGAQTADNWTSTNFGGAKDIIASYTPKGQSPDKQWITIDTNRHPNRAYAMWVDFTGPFTAHPLVSYADIVGPNGKHTAWSQPARLPEAPDSATGSTYLLPHVDPNGTVWTSMTSTPPEKKFEFADISMARSTDAGVTWTNVGAVVRGVAAPPGQYANTNFRDGIFNSFAVGTVKAHPEDSAFPLYVAYEDFAAGYTNVMLTASYDGGAHWTAGVRVNDNATPTDSFQPNAAVAPNGTLAINFYDRRLACPTSEDGSGISQDTWHPRFANGGAPPYGAANYCVNASVQFFKADLGTFSSAPHNIRLTDRTWDPQLNAPHSGCATCSRAFIGDYFGNSFSTVGGVTYQISSFISTFGYPGNSYALGGGATATHLQQQVFARVAIPLT